MHHVYDNSPVPAKQFLHPGRFLKHFYTHRHLLQQFLRRELEAKYKGSALGMVWAIITPLVMMLVYTFVFTAIFNAKWDKADGPSSTADYSLMLFTGFIAYNCFAESVLKAPLLVVGFPNLVKKVVFPIEIMPISVVGSLVVHTLCSLVILFAGILIIQGTLHLTTLWLPLCYIPLIALSLGVSWLVASLGVFLQDIGQFVTVAMQLIFFLTPIVYPITMPPAVIRPFLYLNPLTSIIENFRAVLVTGVSPDWWSLIPVTLVCLAIMMLGYAFFMKSKRAFADVI